MQSPHAIFKLLCTSIFSNLISSMYTITFNPTLKNRIHNHFLTYILKRQSRAVSTNYLNNLNLQNAKEYNKKKNLLRRRGRRLHHPLPPPLVFVGIRIATGTTKIVRALDDHFVLHRVWVATVRSLLRPGVVQRVRLHEEHVQPVIAGRQLVEDLGNHGAIHLGKAQVEQQVEQVVSGRRESLNRGVSRKIEELLTLVDNWRPSPCPVRSTSPSGGAFGRGSLPWWRRRGVRW